MSEASLKIRGLKIACSSKDLNTNSILSRFFYNTVNTGLIINNLNLTVNKHEILGLVGESGSGKSITVKSIFGMINFFPGIIDGSIEYFNADGEKYDVLKPIRKEPAIMDQLGTQTIEFMERIHRSEFDDTVSTNVMESWQYDRELNFNQIKKENNDYHNSNLYEFKKTTLKLSQNLSHEIEKSYNRIKKEGTILRGKEISIILQDPLTFLNPHWSIERQLKNLHRLFPVSDTKWKIKGVSDIENWHKTKKILNELRINSDEFLNKLPSELSGGQAQRVMIVLSRMSVPNLLIADEPTTGLDVTLKRKVVDFFRKRAKSMIFISHDLNMVRMVSDRVNIMYNGEIIENCDAEMLKTGENHHPFTEKLADIFFSNYEDYITDELPDRNTLNSYHGCVYALQGCPYVEEICHKIAPPAIDVTKKKFIQDNNTDRHWVKCWKFLK